MTVIVLLAIVGIAAILAELVLPGGILGAVGALLLLSAVVVTFVEYGATAGILSAIVLVVFSFVVLGWWMKYFHKLPFTRRLILENESGTEEDRSEKQDIIGKTGTTLTDLVPSGRARIDGQKMDVMAEAGSIPKETEVTIVAMRGPSVIVRVLDSVE